VRPVATVVAILVLVLTALPLTGSAQAATGPVADADRGPVTLELTQLDPRVVTAGGPTTLTVIGTLRNTGDVGVSDLEVRVQRGLPLGTEGALRDALDGEATTDAVQSQFLPVPGELPPGGTLPVRLAVPLRGEPGSGLALAATGVHELLVNVNGVPANGARARLAAVRMLLPVLSLPTDPSAPDPNTTDPSTAADPPAASPFTLLYPIAGPPRRLPTVPGEPVLLTDDGLATELTPSGRLGGLVAALTDAPVGSPVRAATCLAVDPDLVQTAALMRTGYQVLEPGGSVVPGRGAAVAGQWLDALTAAARGGCVIALPYADADLVALQRAGLGDLATSAVVDGRTLLADQLGTPVLPQVAWPVDGVLDAATLDGLVGAGGRAVVLSADGMPQGRAQRRAGVLPVAAAGTSSPYAVLSDPLLTLAATGTGTPGAAPVAGAAVTATSAAGSATPLSTQDEIGALAFRARSGPDRSGAPVLLAPPHQWETDGTAAGALLRAVDTLLEGGFLSPRPLTDVLAAGPPSGSAPRAVSYPLRSGGLQVPEGVADAVRATAADVQDLRTAAVPNSGIGLAPDAVLGPLALSLLRPMSAAWQGRPDAAVAAATQCAARITQLRGTVRVLEPPSPYALGTSDAPILVTIGNGLPFTVQVRLEISSTSGLRVAPIEPQQVPPLGRRQTRVSAEVTRSGQFTVRAAVRSPGGLLLGPPSRLRVRSTAYGTITVWLTGSAGILLVVLAVRRILRRVRGEPAVPPIPGPPPEPPDLLAPTPGSAIPVPVKPVSAPVRAGAGTTPRPAGSTPHRSGDPFPEPLPTTERIPAITTTRNQPIPPSRPSDPRPRATPKPPSTPDPTTPIQLVRPAPPDRPPPDPLRTAPPPTDR
jgi:hypothetical protein